MRLASVQMPVSPLSEALPSMEWGRTRKRALSYEKAGLFREPRPSRFTISLNLLISPHALAGAFHRIGFSDLMNCSVNLQVEALIKYSGARDTVTDGFK